MKKIILFLFIPLYLICQEDEFIRDANFHSINLIVNEYSNISQAQNFGSSITWGISDKNELLSLFSNEKSKVYNDIIPDKKFGKEITIEEYSNILYDCGANIFNVNINVLEVKPIIQKSELSGELNIIVEKNIRYNFPDNKKYNLTDKQSIKEEILYEYSFILEFTVEFEKEYNSFLLSELEKNLEAEIISQEQYLIEYEKAAFWTCKIKKITYPKKDTLNAIFYLPKTKSLFSEPKTINVNSIKKHNSNDSIKIQGDLIKYVFKLNDLNETFTLNNNYRKSKSKPINNEKGFKEIELIFMEKLELDIQYNFIIGNGINTSGFNNFHNSFDPLNYKTELTPKYSTSFMIFPKKIKMMGNDNFNFQPGIKITAEKASVNFNAEIPETQTYEYSYPHTDFDEDQYDRIIDIHSLNETINLNRLSAHASLLLSYNYNINNNILQSIAPYIAFNISLYHNKNAEYNSNWDGEISGQYENLNAILFEGFEEIDEYDFGTYNNQSNNSNELDIVKTSIGDYFTDLSEVSIGFKLDFEKVGINFNLTKQLFPVDLIQSIDGPIIGTDSDIAGTIITNSISEVLNSFSINNTYICLGINFKL